MAAEKLIREEFSAYMYAGGRGRVINRAEYLRWKFRDQEQVTIGVPALRQRISRLRLKLLRTLEYAWNMIQDLVSY